MGKPVETPEDYQAARQGAAVAARPDRRFLEVTGRAPGDMLKGILTSRLPGELRGFGHQASPDGERSERVEAFRGEVVYSAILTSKGRMITDLRVLRAEGGGFLLDLPEAGFRGVLSHLKRFLPPRLAHLRDRSEELASLTVLGTGAASLLARVAWSNDVLPGLGEGVEGLTEGSELVVRASSGEIRVTRNGDLNAPAWDLILPRPSAEALLRRLEEEGAVPVTPATWEVLRVERGRPAFGVDMDEKTIPVEAGIHLRAIDYKKGCYTGQEVIVRIRDRGKVSKHFRRLSMGHAPVPERGECLFIPGREKSVGWITSTCSSPAFGETLALGYVRSQVQPAGEVRVGGVDGPVARVHALDDPGLL